ncbi:CDGSH iron-sulfur domain-containing protein [Holophaga foetida]|uniref:CDGSH iron-sulfur domain-containing protein n=1 Tax=Holophaga foetida TaxID=35839 RepID=UPI0002474D89|nr:CDGSH iron-sulfur domain-containing protein [Holophaga foetida]
MSEPRIYDRQPVVLDLEPGTYYWCSCGNSAKQPFCDGSHKGGDFQPLKFEVGKAAKKALCLCKHTEKAPYCDGAHNKV